MAQNITIANASYNAVPAIEVPKQGGGIATFIDSETVVTYYTGSSAPASSLGVDGDIYLQE